MLRLPAILIIALCFKGNIAYSQHCPWDCSGLIMVRTQLKPEQIKTLNPVLVDAKGNIIVDTTYGILSAFNTDTCRFILGEEFLRHRASLVHLNPWYQYDTLLHFCRDHFVARYNYCKYRDQQLSLRYTDRNGSYLFIPVSESNRIHLHDHDREIREGNDDKLLELLGSYILFWEPKY